MRAQSITDPCPTPALGDGFMDRPPNCTKQPKGTAIRRRLTDWLVGRFCFLTIREPDRKSMLGFQKSEPLWQRGPFGSRVSNTFCLRACHSACRARSNSGCPGFLGCNRRTFQSPIIASCRVCSWHSLSCAALLHLCGPVATRCAQDSDGVLSTCRINCAAVVWPEANIGSSSRRNSCHATDRYDGATGDLSTCNSKHCWRRVDVNGGVADRQQHKISR